MDIVALVSEFGFSAVMVGGLGYFVYFVWQTINNKIDPAVQEMKITIIRLTDQLRLLDQDMIRLQQKVNTVLELKEENNSTLARFMRNFESRVYAQLSRQLVEQLFGENPSTEGKLELEGNLIEYVVAEDTVTLTITDENNGQTTITIPVGDFTF